MSAESRIRTILERSEVLPALTHAQDEQIRRALLNTWAAALGRSNLPVPTVAVLMRALAGVTPPLAAELAS